MNGFRKFALITTGVTYCLVFVGGLVRVAGAGLGCPDWPKCFGSWIPPISVDQIPAGIAVENFNVTLAWIEYANRIVGMSVGLLILTTAILAVKYFRHQKNVLFPSLAAGILVAFEGWQGSVVVASELEPIIVTVHMVVALFIVTLLLYATLNSYSSIDSESNQKSQYPALSGTLISILWIVTIFQIILGSQVRQALEHAAMKYPLWNSHDWLSSIGSIDDIHMILGIIVFLFSFYLVISIYKQLSDWQKPIKRILLILITLVLLQAVSGIVLLATGLTAIMDIYHLWLAALFVGVLLVLYHAIKQPNSELFANERRFITFPLALFIGAILLGFTAFVVVSQADKSRAESPPELGKISELKITNLDSLEFDWSSFENKLTIIDISQLTNASVNKHLPSEIYEIFQLYDHSDKVQFYSLHRSTEQYSNSIGLYPTNTEIDSIWHHLLIDSLDASILIGEIETESTPRVILIDSEGIIRGNFLLSSNSILRQFKSIMILLAEELK